MDKTPPPVRRFSMKKMLLGTARPHAMLMAEETVAMEKQAEVLERLKRNQSIADRLTASRKKRNP